jgi:Fur family ferric uptake transcriptional regulator
MPLEPLPISSDFPEMLPEIIEPLCAVFRRKLKSEGLKYTPERARVLDAIVRSEGLFEADGVITALGRSGTRVSKATVYRTIRLLLEAGIVQRILVEGAQARYQLVYGRRPSALLVRLDTGEVESVHIPELIALRDRVCRERGLEARAHHLQIFAAAGVHSPRA